MRLAVIPRVVLLAVLLWACDVLWPTTVCGCTPLSRARLSGSVTDPEGSAVAGARVLSEMASYQECEAGGYAAPPGTRRVSAITDAAGTFELNPGGGGPSCWRLWAEPAAGSGLSFSDTTLLDIAFGSQDPVPNGGVFALALR